MIANAITLFSHACEWLNRHADVRQIAVGSRCQPGPHGRRHAVGTVLRLISVTTTRITASRLSNAVSLYIDCRALRNIGGGGWGSSKHCRTQTSDPHIIKSSMRHWTSHNLIRVSRRAGLLHDWRRHGGPAGTRGRRRLCGGYGQRLAWSGVPAAAAGAAAANRRRHRSAATPAAARRVRRQQHRGRVPHCSRLAGRQPAQVTRCC